MINIGLTRDVLAELLTPPAPPAGQGAAWNVYERGIDGAADFPAVIVGMPRWTPGPTGCIDLHEFPIAVVVKMPGGSSSYSAVIDELEVLWPLVLATLTEAFQTDRRLGRAAHVVRAEFGMYPVQGTPYPAQLIFVSIDG